MATYKVPKLNVNTPQTEKGKLERTLAAITDAERVSLHPEKNEVTISFGKAPIPPQKVIEDALLKSGFSMSWSN